MPTAKPDDGLDTLRKPFAPSVIGKLPKKVKRDDGSTYRVELDYVGHAAVTDRLLTADPQWSWEPMALDDQGLPLYDRGGGLWIKLTVCGVTRYGYGDGPDPKQRIGDAIRNAAMRFGVALDLWTKGELESQDPNGGGGDQIRHVDRGPLPAEQDPWASTPVRQPPDPEAVARVTEQVAGCSDLKTLRSIRADVVAQAKTGSLPETDAADLLSLIDEAGAELRAKYEAEQAKAAS
jgi:hypothetical protein